MASRITKHLCQHQAFDGNEPFIDGIGRQQKAFQGMSAKQYRRVLVAEDADCGPLAAIYPKADLAQVGLSPTAVSHHEYSAIKRGDAETPENRAGNLRVKVAGIDKSVQSLKRTSRGTGDFDGVFEHGQCRLFSLLILNGALNIAAAASSSGVVFAGGDGGYGVTDHLPNLLYVCEVRLKTSTILTIRSLSKTA